MKCPVYDEDNMTVTEFQDLLQQYEIYLKKDKYTVALNFFNEIFNKQYKSLFEIKKMRMSIMVKNIPKYLEIIKKWKKQLNIEYDEDNFAEKDLINVFNKVLHQLGYYMSLRKDDDSEILCSVIERKN
jgi:tetratricopeptide (TPR) repeat protein